MRNHYEPSFVTQKLKKRKEGWSDQWIFFGTSGLVLSGILIFKSQSGQSGHMTSHKALTLAGRLKETKGSSTSEQDGDRVVSKFFGYKNNAWAVNQ